MTTPTLANNAYQMAASLQQQARAVEDTAPQLPSADFGQMVKDAVETIVDKGQQVDEKTIGMIEGKTGVVDVVTAVAETEVALETMVAVRDRVISAYEEIMRMPI